MKDFKRPFLVIFQCEPGYTLSGVNNDLVEDGLVVIKCHLLNNVTKEWEVLFSSFHFRGVQKVCTHRTVEGVKEMRTI